MKGKSNFTQSEANEIIALIRKKVVSDRNTQKRLRDKIRGIGFYATDFGIGGGYTEHDFLRVVKIVGETHQPEPKSEVIELHETIQPERSTGELRKISFPPISNPNAKILILGTMPGEQSLFKSQYYGHGGNQFWKIMFICLNEPFTDDYEIKKNLLIDNKIALWDVLQHCKRQGSSDNAIVDEFPNDFQQFFKSHPNVRTILFNGNNAAEYYQKYVGYDSKFKYDVLPSTSPANTWSTREEKAEKWQQEILNNLKESIK